MLVAAPFSACRWLRWPPCCWSWPKHERSPAFPPCAASPRKRDILVMLACFLLTVVFDMVVAVSAGVVLAALLFMGHGCRCPVQLVGDRHPEIKELPPGVIMYRIAGPLFFSAGGR